jgi:hypothetical protein
MFLRGDRLIIRVSKTPSTVADPDSGDALTKKRRFPMRFFTCFRLVIGLLLISQPAWTQGLPHIWSQHFGDTNDQEVASVAVDSSGNVIVTGRFEGTVDFGGGPLTSAGQTDVYVAKFGPSGNHLWSQHFGDDTFQTAVDVAVDTSGNVIVTGYFYGTINLGGQVLTSAGENDIYLAKFDRSGTHIWSDRFGDVGYDYVAGVACDLPGNVIIAGFYYTGDIDFGGGTLMNAGEEDIYIAKFDPSGTHLWSDNFGDSDGQSAADVAVDGLGNVIITGGFDGTVNFGGGALTSAGAKDIFVAKFDPSGLHVWSDDFGDPAWQLPVGVASDDAGNVFIAGTFMGSVNFGAGDMTSAGGMDIYIAKFNSSGSVLWGNRFGDASADGFADIAVEPSANIVITGHFSGTINFGGGDLTSAGGRDIYLAGFGADGSYIWSKRFGNTDIDQGVSVAAYGTCAIVTGEFQGGVDFGGGALTSAGGDDIFLAKFGNDACPTQLQRFIVAYKETGIEVKWELAEAGVDMQFLILRADAASTEFRQLASPKINRNGLSFTFIDESYEPGTTYRYRVDVLDNDGYRVLFETEDIVPPETQLALSQNFPNPFNPTTAIEFFLPKTAPVELSIFNLEGKLVRTLVDDVLNNGFKEYQWDGKDTQGSSVSSGMYFYRLKVGNRTLTKKMTLIK